MSVVTIDGSILEGGGQILRNALSFSALCKIPLRVINIRKGRSGPGLKAQHLSGVNLIKKICNATVEGAELGSETLTFKPNQILGGNYNVDTGTAGSVALLLQVSLPVCYFANNPVTLELKGGTNCEMAPQIDYLTEVFRPNLEKFGPTFDFDLFRRGYFPRGGGHISVSLRPVNCLEPIRLCEQGNVSEIFGWSFVAGTLPIKLAHEMADGAIRAVQNRYPKINVNIERYKEDPKMVEGNCSGIILVCQTTTGCILGGDALGSRKVSPTQTGVEAANQILEALSQGACVDKHTQDMIIIFMALAKGRSIVQVGEITLHTKTAIYVAEELTKAKFNIKNVGEQSNIIECDGIGLENR